LGQYSQSVPKGLIPHVRMRKEFSHGHSTAHYRHDRFPEPFPASAQMDRLFKGFGLGQQSGLNDVKIGSGLKEALKVGTENTINLTGKADGYFLNQAIKILMPRNCGISRKD